VIDPAFYNDIAASGSMLTVDSRILAPFLTIIIAATVLPPLFTDYIISNPISACTLSRNHGPNMSSSST
jgi:hypothetical protein